MTAGELKRSYENYSIMEQLSPEDLHIYRIVRHFADDLPLSDLMLKWLREEAKSA